MTDARSVLATLHAWLAEGGPSAAWPGLLDAMEEVGLDAAPFRGNQFRVYAVPTAPAARELLMRHAKGDFREAARLCAYQFGGRPQAEAFSMGLTAKDGHVPELSLEAAARRLEQLFAADEGQSMFEFLLEERHAGRY